MKALRFALIVLSMLVLVLDGTAQVRKAGLNAAAFLKVGVGARNVGLGSASSSITEDVSQMFWNPAGIALQNFSLQGTVSYNKWIADLNHNAFGISYKLGDIGTIGVGAIMFGVNGITAYRDVAPTALKSQQIDQATADTYDYQDLALQATFARDFSEQLSLGVTFKYISETLDDQTKSAVAVDLGSIYTIGSLGNYIYDWKISARLSNMGSGIKYYDVESPIPITFSVGTSFLPLKDDKIGELLIAVDAVKPQDSPQLFYVGGEYTFGGLLSIRGGWKFNYTGAEDEGRSTRAPIKQSIEGLSVGGGVHVEMGGYDLRFDYAMTSMDILDSVHRVTLTVGLK
ncbi:MAG: PorV/PorQ family protein [Ignavibacteria bacterium]|nr:PorV/PorQ family protein [Ignavibacteria bacterium]